MWPPYMIKENKLHLVAKAQVAKGLNLMFLIEAACGEGWSSDTLHFGCPDNEEMFEECAACLKVFERKSLLSTERT